MEFLDEYLKVWRPEEMRLLTDREYCTLEALLETFPRLHLSMMEMKYQPEKRFKHEDVKRLLTYLLKYNQKMRALKNMSTSTDRANQFPEANSTAENENVTPLTKNEKKILTTMLSLRTVDADSRKSTEEIAVATFGEYSDANSKKKLISDLKKKNLVETKIGAGGGCWLTAHGKERANSLKEK